MSTYLLPTDTCYGLAGDFTEQDYYEIYRLKGRDFDKRLAVLVRDFDMLREYTEVSDEQIEFLQNYTNPWSVILPRKNIEKFPEPLQGAEYEYISFRVADVCLRYHDEGSDAEKQKRIVNNSWIATPSARNDEKGFPLGVGQKEYSGVGEGIKQNHFGLLTFDFSLQYPLFLTSANLSGQSESTTLEQAQKIFPGIEGIAGGVCDSPPSDIFRFLPNGGVEYMRKNY